MKHVIAWVTLLASLLAGQAFADFDSEGGGVGSALVAPAPVEAETDAWSGYLDYAYVYSSAEPEALAARLRDYGNESRHLARRLRHATSFEPAAPRTATSDEEDAASAASAIARPAAVPLERASPMRSRRASTGGARARGPARPSREPLLVPLHPGAPRARARARASTSCGDDARRSGSPSSCRSRRPTRRSTRSRSSDAPNSGFVAALPYIYENIARMVADPQPADGRRPRPRSARRDRAPARRRPRRRVPRSDSGRRVVARVPRAHHRAARRPGVRRRQPDLHARAVRGEQAPRARRAACSRARASARRRSRRCALASRRLRDRARPRRHRAGRVRRSTRACCARSARSTRRSSDSASIPSSRCRSRSRARSRSTRSSRGRRRRLAGPRLPHERPRGLPRPRCAGCGRRSRRRASTRRLLPRAQPGGAAAAPTRTRAHAARALRALPRVLPPLRDRRPARRRARLRLLRRLRSRARATGDALLAYATHPLPAEVELATRSATAAR